MCLLRPVIHRILESSLDITYLLRLKHLQSAPLLLLKWKQILVNTKPCVLRKHHVAVALRSTENLLFQDPWPDSHFLKFKQIFFILHANHSPPTLFLIPPPSLHPTCHQLLREGEVTSLYLSWTRYPSKGMCSKEPANELGINSGPIANGTMNINQHSEDLAQSYAGSLAVSP